MASDDAAVRPLFEHLRRLVVEQPREARMTIAQLLDEPPTNLGELLELISLPGEGRLRHAVANAVIEKSARAAAVPQLAYWHSIETDEFTKRALRKALSGTAKTSIEPAGSANNVIVEQNFFEAYRYVHRRMMHRVGNAMGQPYEIIELIKENIAAARDTIPVVNMTQLVEELEARFRLLGRVVEFDLEEPQFQIRQISLHDWLHKLNRRYAEKYSSIALAIKSNAACRDVNVLASDYLLDEIFWNIWVNAHQEVRKNCQITVHFSIRGTFIRLKIIDNGPGFSEIARDAAFAHSYSSKPRLRGHSGRGMLEIKDAVERLHGTVAIVEDDGRFRIMLELPWVST